MCAVIRPNSFPINCICSLFVASSPRHSQKLLAHRPGELSFRAFDMNFHKSVDVVFVDKGIGIAGLSGPHGIELLKSIVVLGVDVDDRVDACFILDILEAFEDAI